MVGVTKKKLATQRTQEIVAETRGTQYGGEMTIQERVPLAPHTTIRLGGPARYFAPCTSQEDIEKALQFAQEQTVPVHILGGGSNTIFGDEGYNGLVIHIELKGITFTEGKTTTKVTVQAGEIWDTVVEQCVKRGLTGIESLSGIPGYVGATPMQNVGAYGQQVSDTITKVEAIDTTTRKRITFTNNECNFSYRNSRFKSNDKGRYIITRVTYELTNNGTPIIQYPQLQEALAEQGGGKPLGSGREAAQRVREAVLKLRRKKSMVLDEHDLNTRSCGSFFVNPVITEEQRSTLPDDIPSFAEGENIKLSAAWLIEHAGFKKGQRYKGVGISENHALALINREGSTNELLEFAEMIKGRVKEKFGVGLEQEPITIGQQ